MPSDPTDLGLGPSPNQPQCAESCVLRLLLLWVLFPTPGRATPHLSTGRRGEKNEVALCRKKGQWEQRGRSPSSEEQAGFPFQGSEGPHLGTPASRRWGPARPGSSPHPASACGSPTHMLLRKTTTVLSSFILHIYLKYTNFF